MFMMHPLQENVPPDVSTLLRIIHTESLTMSLKSLQYRIVVTPGSVRGS